ncbi:gamma-glutamylcyclotransferase [Emticicia sp. C21]|nr:gamma-glutamylcyclotransferase [Emticicia sp. C21]
METYQPEKVLIVYGTLAPGKPNHSKIEHIKGEWEKIIVKGKLVKEGWGAELGYYGFTHAAPEEQITIEAYVLFSDELPANWQYLDDFEGNGYKRIIAKYELGNGKIGVGYIYAINDRN